MAYEISAFRVPCNYLLSCVMTPIISAISGVSVVVSIKIYAFVLSFRLSNCSSRKQILLSSRLVYLILGIDKVC